MREEVLKQFFEGKVNAAELAADVSGSTTNVGGVVSYQRVEEMDSEFRVDRTMLIALCDAVLAGGLSPELLHEIGFALVSSDRFVWDADDDELVSDTISDWSAPEVNYPLTIENIRRCKAWLNNEEHYPVKKVGLSKGLDRIISIRHRTK
ncbi:MAG TPA: hypothetical protein VG897_07000 [Terriglobales bacterium]|nr:hypothetical protein [Terriglobales bacterium]